MKAGGSGGATRAHPLRPLCQAAVAAGLEDVEAGGVQLPVFVWCHPQGLGGEQAALGDGAVGLRQQHRALSRVQMVRHGLAAALGGGVWAQVWRRQAGGGDSRASLAPAGEADGGATGRLRSERLGKFTRAAGSAQCARARAPVRVELGWVLDAPHAVELRRRQALRRVHVRQVCAAAATGRRRWRSAACARAATCKCKCCKMARRLRIAARPRRTRLVAHKRVASRVGGARWLLARVELRAQHAREEKHTQRRRCVSRCRMHV